MKKIILAIAITGISSASLLAQSPIQAPGQVPVHNQKKLSPAEQAKQNTERAAKELGLSNEQKVKWEVAALERINANAPMREKIKGSTTPEERRNIRQQTRVNNQKFEQTVTAFLTPDQKSKFDKLKEDKKEMHRNGRKGGRKLNDEVNKNTQQDPSKN